MSGPSLPFLPLWPFLPRRPFLPRCPRIPSKVNSIYRYLNILLGVYM
jgi:hypothetical protein